jgi:phosphatidylserine/phosphatidylglycerophosphate/cardiolipin synthase-like enzyme
MPEDGMDALIEPLRGAQRSIDIYVFTLSNAEMLAALREAVARGVKVRALVDMHPSGNDAAGKAAFDSLQHAGVEARPSPKYFAHLHAKSYVVDSAQAMISSVNYLQDWQRTRDFGLLTADDGVVQALAATFAADWHEDEKQTGTVPPPPLVLSPNNSRSVIAELIASATRSLILEEEQITDPDIISALAARSNAGVSVQLVTNSAQEKNYKPLESLAAQAPGVQIGYSSALWLHSKLLISDGAVMLVGSVNLTEESLDKRREVSIVLTDRAAIAKATEVAQNDLATASPVPLDSHKRPQSPADSPAEGGNA